MISKTRIQNALTYTNGDILNFTNNAEHACSEYIDTDRLDFCREIRQMLIDETGEKHWPTTTLAEKAFIFASLAHHFREQISKSDRKAYTRQ